MQSVKLCGGRKLWTKRVATTCCTQRKGDVWSVFFKPIKKRNGLVRSVAAVLAVAVVAGGLCTTARATGCHWYCVRAEDHAQPRADAALEFVERHEGYYIDHRHTEPDAEEKVVYLTFDVGYENGNVARVLDALASEGATGAFFILGHVAEKNPELVRRMAEEGHLVCNHTYSHRNMTGRCAEEFAAELEKMEDTCRDCTGVEMAKYFRPPEGTFDEQMLCQAKELGYKTIFWSFAYADWDNGKQPAPDAAKRKILDNVHNGAVILLHPTSATNAAILGDVLRELKSQGYRFGTLDELVGKRAGDLARPTAAPAAVAEQEIVYHSRKNDRMEIALSFDDGPHPRYTPEILSILAEYGVRATFFMVGENVGYYPDAATAVLEAGHEIGNHTFSHHRMRRMSLGEIREEILACEDAISSLGEYRPRFVRPPEGCMNDGLRQAAAELDYRIVLWDVDTLDWAHTPPATIAQHILDEVEAGDIILMHDFIGHNSPTPAALRLVIPALLEQGYHFVTVGELVDGDARVYRGIGNAG